MNKEEALQFLWANQPLPPDDQLGERIVMFNEVRKFFQENYDPRCLEPLLNAFGDGSGFGVYQLVEDTVDRYPSELVVPQIHKALHSPHRGVRYWNAELAANFPSEILVDDLARLLDEDIDLRYAAVTALAQIDAPSAKAALRNHLPREQDAELKEIILDALGET